MATGKPGRFAGPDDPIFSGGVQMFSQHRHHTPEPGPAESQPVPAGIASIRDAARRLNSRFVLHLSFRPAEPGPAWQYHAHKHHMILRTDDPQAALAGVGLALVAQSGGWLGKGITTSETPLSAELEDRRFGWLLALQDQLREVAHG